VHVCVGPAPAGRPVTGGAFRRYDDDTAELKRIWTDSGHRRRGYATGAAGRARSRDRQARLSPGLAGHRSPEAEALYESVGRKAADDSDLVARGITYLRPFQKQVP